MKILKQRPYLDYKKTLKNILFHNHHSQTIKMLRQRRYIQSFRYYKETDSITKNGPYIFLLVYRSPVLLFNISTPNCYHNTTTRACNFISGFNVCNYHRCIIRVSSTIFQENTSRASIRVGVFFSSK